MIDLLAYRRHLRRLKMCEDTLMSDKKSWQIDFRDHYRKFEATGWREKIELVLGGKEDRIITLNPCRFCSVCIKTHQAPDAFYGDGINTTARNQLTCPR